MDKNKLVLSNTTSCLAPLCGGMIKAKLQSEEFLYHVQAIDNIVRFPAEWPGDLAPVFKIWAGQCETDHDTIPGTFVIIDNASLQAVGAIGTKSFEFFKESIEIGYGIIPSAQKKGIATMALQLLTDWLFSFPVIKRITAETSQSNIASQRVLEKCGFTKQGTGWSEEDGDLFLWTLEKTTNGKYK